MAEQEERMKEWKARIDRELVELAKVPGKDLLRLIRLGHPRTRGAIQQVGSNRRDRAERFPVA